MSHILTYISRYFRTCFTQTGYVYCIHNPDNLDQIRGDEPPPAASGRATRREDFKTVA
jgi:hypothetical protein